MRVAAELNGSQQAAHAAAKPLSAPLYPSAWQTARGGQRGRPWVPLRPRRGPAVYKPLFGCFRPAREAAAAASPHRP